MIYRIIFYHLLNYLQNTYINMTKLYLCSVILRTDIKVTTSTGIFFESAMSEITSKQEARVCK